jgi:replicative DNA helicase
MDNKLLLAKAITLLYQESKLVDKIESSTDLIRTVLENVKVSDVGIGMNTDREVILALKSTILEMCSNQSDHEYNKSELVQRIQINTLNDEKLFEAIITGLDDDLNEAQIKRSTVSIRKSINNHFKEQQINEILNKASYSFKYQREKIKDINQFITDVVTQLEPLQITNSSKDPAIINEIDVGDDSSMREVFAEMQKINNGSTIYKTGWQELNNMCQGGFRPGETVVIGAVQHKYKTGFTLSLFAQIALFNTPPNDDSNKKPLLLRISFEDELVNNLEFLYQYLKYNETKERVYMKDLTVDEMTNYVKEQLQVNGFHIKMMRVDPNNWTYKSICNKVIELEAQGYSVKVLMVDYLSQVSKIGCTNTGMIGGEVGDLMSRIRNFTSAKKILFITPHQLSTEAKNLLRGGLPEDHFVKEIAEKGYWEGNKGLDRIFDLGLLIHLFKHNGETYLSIQRDKHRISSIVEDAYKYFIMKFPKFMPLPHDYDVESTGFRKLPSAASNASEDLFKLG